MLETVSDNLKNTNNWNHSLNRVKMSRIDQNMYGKPTFRGKKKNTRRKSDSSKIDKTYTTNFLSLFRPTTLLTI